VSRYPIADSEGIGEAFWELPEAAVLEPAISC
jgi:hypothetical protein